MRGVESSETAGGYPVSRYSCAFILSVRCGQTARGGEGVSIAATPSFLTCSPSRSRSPSRFFLPASREEEFTTEARRIHCRSRNGQRSWAGKREFQKSFART